jgi:hypothetical protein
MVKRNILSASLILAGVALLSSMAWLAPAYAASSKNVAEDHGFSVKEYEEFRHALHPLQHEALPAKDFKRIRAAAGELVKRGEAILKLGVPRGVEKKDAEEFDEKLKEFGAALVKFRSDAAGGRDDQLKESYITVHDSFESLADMLPRK